MRRLRTARCVRKAGWGAGCRGTHLRCEARPRPAPTHPACTPVEGGGGSAAERAGAWAARARGRRAPELPLSPCAHPAVRAVPPSFSPPQVWFMKMYAPWCGHCKVRGCGGKRGAPAPTALATPPARSPSGPCSACLPTPPAHPAAPGARLGRACRGVCWQRARGGGERGLHAAPGAVQRQGRARLPHPQGLLQRRGEGDLQGWVGGCCRGAGRGVGGRGGVGGRAGVGCATCASSLLTPSPRPSCRLLTPLPPPFTLQARASWPR